MPPKRRSALLKLSPTPWPDLEDSSMRPTNAEAVALVATMVVFFVIVMVLPAVRVRRRFGVSAVVVHKEVNGFQRLIGIALGVIMAGLFAWSVLLLVLGP